MTRKVKPKTVYKVENKTFSVLFQEKEDAETFFYDNATAANGLDIYELQLFVPDSDNPAIKPSVELPEGDYPPSDVTHFYR